MADRQLEHLITGLDIIARKGFTDFNVTAVVYDSRDSVEGCLFFALPGIHVDGHRFIDQAIDAGAAGVVHSDELDDYRPGITYIRVADTRASLSPVSAAYWGNPSKELTVIGVTGTDGKSTTVSLIRQLLGFCGVSAGSISTVEFTVGEHTGSNIFRQSTPEAPQIHGLLRAMLDAGQTHAVVEATSHGLSPKTSRLADVDFDAAVFTNVTSEHLEFHGNLETYRLDKSRLFSAVAESKNRDAFGVINADDPNAELFIEAAGEKPVFTYSLKYREADIFASDLKTGPAGTNFSLHTPMGRADASISLPGLYNVENVLAALCTVSELEDEDPLVLAPRLPELRGVKGRMEPVEGDMSFHVLVDYAHSPGSFIKLLPFLKSLAEGRLILVFGSAGERDKGKRPEQGAIAADFADIIYLADEDPRGEDSMDILKDIAAGVKGFETGESLFLIPDRRMAIESAFKSARAGDLVAVLGKGHEGSIIYADGPMDWDEARVCREVLRELGYEA
ncbi:MAG: UDP-N-acetylmuramoyl-L-alanyl-D-glutamate--2,6-diaminopimelate ligase [Spirochaetaceae bacterium]|nr:UDP-N-acetylmuramoyl-L-alanyl-D-glutamate--2,6-diaminopimelate ligase [Spirochaetaceae bacterium]